MVSEKFLRAFFRLPKESADHEQPTLRDRFAMAALQALAHDLSFGTVGKPSNPWPWVTEQAYAAADAMLRARQQAQPEGG